LPAGIRWRFFQDGGAASEPSLMSDVLSFSGRFHSPLLFEKNRASPAYGIPLSCIDDWMREKLTCRVATFFPRKKDTMLKVKPGASRYLL